jgi:hypothetical protein
LLTVFSTTTLHMSWKKRVRSYQKSKTWRWLVRSKKCIISLCKLSLEYLALRTHHPHLRRYRDIRIGETPDIDQSRRLRRKSPWRRHLSTHRGCPHNHHISAHHTLSEPSTAKSLVVSSQPRNLHCAVLVCMTAYSLSASVAATPTVGYDFPLLSFQPTASSAQSKTAVAVPIERNTHPKISTTQNYFANYDAITKTYWVPGATSQLAA